MINTLITSYSIAIDSIHTGFRREPVNITKKFVLLVLIVIGMEFVGLELMETPKYFI
jgi:hypothetical protein